MDSHWGLQPERLVGSSRVVVVSLKRRRFSQNPLGQAHETGLSLGQKVGVRGLVVQNLEDDREVESGAVDLLQGVGEV